MKSTNLDLLRAIAVMSVYVGHLIGASGLYTMGSLGRFGVIIFFVHTSLVLMASLERLEAGGLGSGWRLAAAFWIRRLFRIYPLAIVFVVFAVLVGLPPEHGAPTVQWPASVVLSNLALVQNLLYLPDVQGILWSLPLEVQMYVLLPFAYMVLRRRSTYAAAGLWLLALGLALTVPVLSPRLSVFTYAPCFTGGLVAYDLGRRFTRPLPGWLWLPIVLASIAAFGPLDNIRLADKMWRAWVLALGLGVAAGLTREHTWTWLNQPAHWIAEHSYGIYLSHIPVFWVALTLMAGQPFILRALVLLLGSVLMPVLCYRLVEQPLMRLGANIATRVRPLPDTARAHV